MRRRRELLGGHSGTIRRSALPDPGRLREWPQYSFALYLVPDPRGPVSPRRSIWIRSAKILTFPLRRYINSCAEQKAVDATRNNEAVSIRYMFFPLRIRRC